MSSKNRSKCYMCGRVRYVEHLGIVKIPTIISPLFNGNSQIYICMNFSSGKYANQYKMGGVSCATSFSNRITSLHKNVSNALTLLTVVQIVIPEPTKRLKNNNSSMCLSKESELSEKINQVK